MIVEGRRRGPARLGHKAPVTHTELYDIAQARSHPETAWLPIGNQAAHIWQSEAPEP